MNKENTPKVVETPLMKQHNAIKAKYPDALLLFRVGDFYETFGEDAIKSSEILGIVLTKRANGAASFIELAGFPHHALDMYLPKLVKAGLRVAICDQLEDPKLTKTLVKRGVTELVTPGVSYNDKTLDIKSNNFLASIHFDPRTSGVAFLDISTGEFYIAHGNNEYIDKLLQSFRPNEIIIQKNKYKSFIEVFGDKFYITKFEDWVFTKDFAEEILLKHFQTKSLKGFGVENIEYGIIAAGAALHYLAETQHDKVSHICKLSRIEEDNYVWLDKFTIRNLEIFGSFNDDTTTLIYVIDQTISPMGSRLMKRWLALPLKNKQKIDERLDVVDYFLENADFADNLRHSIKIIGDLERLISKVATARVNPREIIQLKKALTAIEQIKSECAKYERDILKKIADQLQNCLLIRNRIEKEINEDPPVLVSKGGVIADGISEELDELRKIHFSGKDYLANLQEREIQKTGISSLKISFNNVFGYYIEVRNTHKDKVPAGWIRKQTLVNAERYITEELKEYEEKILGAEEKILTLETNLFNDLILALTDYIEPIQLDATLIAHLDCLLSFAATAKKNNYNRPEINNSTVLNIKNGRHPVIERFLPHGEEYIANDIYLDNESQQMMMITGPNMSGKSALLRQVGLIVIMAQIGSYVPCDSAQIGIIDKLFTRVGASDNISLGESTFMVEMNETASILNNISNRSLILLDEIGRGTSTYDGISIAWAIAEFLHEHPKCKAKTLFATHYHELNDMAKTFPRVKNFNVSVKELNNKIIFLRKLSEGGSEHSFGIHVAKMAGMPSIVVDRANKILQQLEDSHEETNLDSNHKNKKPKKDDYQLSFFQLDDPLLEDIRDIILKTDIDSLTPIEALMKLNQLKKMLGGK
ncbi:MAG: DNA mismatch repair protein MutS [Bacteroidota bacterium]|nr:DNA mismatch repair protein MutS [Bacteroidota bacterium]